MSGTQQIRIGRRTVEVSRLDKQLFPDDGITKGDLIDYYHSVAHLMVPYLRGRPLALERFPDGLDGERIFQQHMPSYFPDWIDAVSVKKVDSRDRVRHAIVSNTAALVYVANQACITPHAWLARADRPEHPDQLIFDLDPPDGFAAARRAALALRDVLTEVGLRPFVKTTGGKGLHVHVRLDRKAPFDDVREFAMDLAHVLVARDPKRYTTEQRKLQREGRLYFDVMRNAYGQTAVAPYSVRARDGATVATPLDWAELEDDRLTSERFTLRTVPERIERNGDVWQGASRRPKSLGPARQRLDRLLE
jgi:bifunctional non-homologous end joining protein LigD